MGVHQFDLAAVQIRYRTATPKSLCIHSASNANPCKRLKLGLLKCIEAVNTIIERFSTGGGCGSANGVYKQPDWSSLLWRSNPALSQPASRFQHSIITGITWPGGLDVELLLTLLWELGSVVKHVEALGRNKWFHYIS